MGILALIDYLWLCTSDCGSLATAIFGTAIAPVLGVVAGYSVVLVVGLTIMVLARLVDSLASLFRRRG